MQARTAALVAVLLLAPLTACGGNDKADPAACKAAMTKQMEDAIKNGTKSDGRPSECNGVDDKTVQKYASEIMEDQIGKQVQDGLKDATAQP